MLIGGDLEEEDREFFEEVQRRVGPNTVLLDALRGRGVPDEFIQDCSFLIVDVSDDEQPGSHGEPVMLNVGGNSSKRTLDELLRAVQLGLGLSLNLAPGFDLHSLDTILPLVRHLDIGSYGHIVGWDALHHALKMIDLRIHDEPDQPLDLSGLHHLRSFIGVGRNAAYAALSPSLGKLVLDLDVWPEDLAIAGPVRELKIYEARKIRALPTLNHPEALRIFSVAYAKQFDLGSLTASRNLERLEVAPCGSVEHASALLALTNLQYVEFGRLNTMTERETLTKLTVPQLRIWENQAIPATEAHQLSARTGWSVDFIEPQPKGARRREISFVDGRDPHTFWPFELSEPIGENSRYQLAFSDWSLLSDRFEVLGYDKVPYTSTDLEEALQEALLKSAPALVDAGWIEFDSEGDFLFVWADSQATLTTLARTATGMFKSDRQLRRLAEKVLKNNPSD